MSDFFYWLLVESDWKVIASNVQLRLVTCPNFCGKLVFIYLRNWQPAHRLFGELLHRGRLPIKLPLSGIDFGEREFQLRFLNACCCCSFWCLDIVPPPAVWFISQPEFQVFVQEAVRV